MRHVAQPFSELQPIAAMNITPLIDVMLVLIVTMIVSVPLVTHKVPIDLPPPGIAGLPPVTHILSLAPDGGYSWDGVPIPDAALTPQLAALNADPKRPLLMLDVAGTTRYERFDQTIAVIKRARVSQLAFVGNQKWASWRVE